MSKLTRRKLLVFFGASTAATVLAPQIGQKLLGGDYSVADAATSTLGITPVRLPHPLPIYQTKKSALPTGINQSQLLEPSSDISLASYTVIDDVVVPPEYERYVIVKWGDRVFPNPDDYFGYNNDYTGFVPVARSSNDGYLWVNHEYVSFPFSDLAPGTSSSLAGLPTSFETVIGYPLPSNVNDIELLGEFFYNQGGSIVRIRRNGSGERFQVVKDDSKNRRIHGLSGLGINAQRSDQFKTVTSWGSRSHQRGDQNYLVGTGPAATEVFSLSSDGLGNKIIGTAYNCSGGTTPWGTILTTEENFQASATFFNGVTEAVLPDGTQTGYTEGTTGSVFGLVGEKYGWMVEIDPVNPSVRAKKHTALGRFRHENITFRTEAGNKLVAYMGDDRRGGHTWKYVSKGKLRSLSDKDNSKLFEEGTLYVAKFNSNGTGEWIPLVLSTPTNPNVPSELASVELAALGEAQRDGRVRLPQRAGIAGATEDGGSLVVDFTNEATALPGYKKKTLADFYTSQGAIVVDSFLAANLVGGTPSSRPEDLEVHPRTKAVFIAYTDHIAGGDGYPDSRIFQTAKLNADVDAKQPSGGIYKIIENSADGTGTSFRWTRFVESGEAGADDGAGFANVDNLAFDTKANVWGVTDMSTSQHNGFRTGAEPAERTIDHTDTGATSSLVGVYGNNWVFYIPTSGPDAGEVIPFAYGPMRCEITGPTFIGDTLIVAVQHPGESVPIGAGQPPLQRDIEILNLDGTLFTQSRTVPLGSNWPSSLPKADGGDGNPSGPPRPSVVGIRRKSGDRLV
ncbi:PhoX family phosphatase [Moorena producens JHB]|uniref:PhoX family phosphatase n=1 Tax=Moorena producens (strain JHB) TaxID=1454205 RepID=A0A1D9G5U6_MOOP1|nr:PhoX family phosphatase [Moorena producens]AOY82790.1 PhoX family phosphatase [Moorena producens JHB]